MPKIKIATTGSDYMLEYLRLKFGNRKIKSKENRLYNIEFKAVFKSQDEYEKFVEDLRKIECFIRCEVDWFAS